MPSPNCHQQTVVKVNLEEANCNKSVSELVNLYENEKLNHANDKKSPVSCKSWERNPLKSTRLIPRNTNGIYPQLPTSDTTLENSFLDVTVTQ